MSNYLSTLYSIDKVKKIRQKLAARIKNMWGFDCLDFQLSALFSIIGRICTLYGLLVAHAQQPIPSTIFSA